MSRRRSQPKDEDQDWSAFDPLLPQRSARYRGEGETGSAARGVDEEFDDAPGYYAPPGEPEDHEHSFASLVGRLAGVPNLGPVTPPPRVRFPWAVVEAAPDFASLVALLGRRVG